MLAALDKALMLRRPENSIHHSDLGSQPRFNWSSQHGRGSTNVALERFDGGALFESSSFAQI